MKRLRAAAKIEYVGESSKRDAVATPKTAEEPKSQSKSGSAADSEDALQQGLKSLGK